MRRRWQEGVANPIGAILTAAMMLDYLGYKTVSQAVEAAVRQSVLNSETTRDLGGTLSTEAAGAAIRERIL